MIGLESGERWPWEQLSEHEPTDAKLGSLVVFVVVLLHNSYAYMIATLM